jgi:hypothetical protein
MGFNKNFDAAFAKISSLLSPYLQKQGQISDYSLDAGKENIAAGTAGIGSLINHYKGLISGSRDEVLSNVDVSGITKSYDQAASNLANFGARGGRSAGQLAGLDFEKASQINKIAQNLRDTAPHELENLYNSLLGLGTGQLNLAAGTNAANLSSVTGVANSALQKAMADAQNKAALIGSIFSAAGGTLGAILGAKLGKG